MFRIPWLVWLLCPVERVEEEGAHSVRSVKANERNGGRFNSCRCLGKKVNRLLMASGAHWPLSTTCAAIMLMESSLLCSRCLSLSCLHCRLRTSTLRKRHPGSQEDQGEWPMVTKSIWSGNLTHPLLPLYHSFSALSHTLVSRNCTFLTSIAMHT